MTIDLNKWSAEVVMGFRSAKGSTAHCPCHGTEYVKLERVWPEQIQEWPE